MKKVLLIFFLSVIPIVGSKSFAQHQKGIDEISLTRQIPDAFVGTLVLEEWSPHTNITTMKVYVEYFFENYIKWLDPQVGYKVYGTNGCIAVAFSSVWYEPFEILDNFLWHFSDFVFAKSQTHYSLYAIIA